MDGDLSLSQSLGGLRIANPDNGSPASLKEDPMNNLAASLSPVSSPTHSPFTNGGETLSPQSLPQVPSNDLLRSSSPLDFDPASFSSNDLNSASPPPTAEKASQPLAKDLSSYAQRQANRQSIPLTYQDQQQAQFPQYPTMMPINQRHPSSSARPVSAMYTQSPVMGANGGMHPREGLDRVRSEFSRSSMYGLPQRANSRGASMAIQAGVPSREGSYTDRSYGQNQPSYNGRAPLPPRRSSRGMGSSQTNSLGGVAQAQMKAPAYIEGGPITSSEEWQERGAAVGVRQEMDANGKPVLRSVKKGFRDFKFGRTLGEGSYSTVMAAEDRETNKEYAIKVLDKRHIIKEKKVKYVNVEKDTLNRLNDHPGVVRLYYTFQDERQLYFVLDLAINGELLGVLKRMTTFDEECTRFYGAEILDTVSYMHSRGIIHRDLKPENVLLDDHMHVKITDFGTAKILDLSKNGPGNEGFPGAEGLLDGSDKNRANSFVGTAEYVSPELLKDKSACKASDLWAFGCIIYQLLAGRPPFKAGNEYLTFQKIIALEYEFPKGFPEVAKDLVERLLVLDPASRLSIEHIKNHQFFKGVTWGRGLWKLRPPKLRSFTPATSPPKKLNGSNNLTSYPPNIAPSHSTSATHYESGTASNAGPRPGPKLITELPPPTQLDIEWSPVLTKDNERILKLGNLLVLSSPTAHSPNSAQSGDGETPKKFSRFFGSSSPKKRQRLVMVTSSARIIIAAAGGEEKKTKTEVSLLGAGCLWRKMQDPKGLTYWCVDSKDKHFTFEDPKSTSSDGSATSASAQEWLDAIELARELAASQSTSSSYPGEDVLKDLQPSSSSSPRALDLDAPETRHTLQKLQPTESDSFMGRKRFSKRQSKSGLSAVF
ncbi:MAG: hypothetical protein LQ351_001364 [Letrouitia transgressa]|nr:MAG: hypothetical protein LQ351_001364 [Letrouitia transgressa]